ncbi:MAG TPA: spore germination protein GerW family protein [Gemmatimonadales bacterium]|nr:spore germination protein GerW family protein [Gemmatimonadales bacterium]
MSTNDLIESAVEHLRLGASVKTVYGEPIVIDGKTIIPVAKVAYGFGGGTATPVAEGGAEPDAKKQASAGGGGGIAAKPVGVVEISAAETKFVPFGQPKKFAITALVGSGLGLLAGVLLGRRAFKN